MPSVAELSDPYGNFLLGPRPGAGVCSQCFNLTDGYSRCYACSHCARRLDAMVPISYSVAGEQLHRALAGYKRLNGTVARRFTLGLAAVLWRYLAAHEGCLARSAGVDRFALVTAVPSSGRTPAMRSSGRTPAARSAGRVPAAPHPLTELVALAGPVRERYQPLLRRSAAARAPHRFDADQFAPLRELSGETVLLIDDTWTTGASAQSAAAALKAAGAGAVAAVVIGRHVNREWHHNDRRLRSLPLPYDWDHCALCAAGAAGCAGA